MQFATVLSGTANEFVLSRTLRKWNNTMYFYAFGVFSKHFDFVIHP
jgi:hypothetical protein